MKEHFLELKQKLDKTVQAIWIPFENFYTKSRSKESSAFKKDKKDEAWHNEDFLKQSTIWVKAVTWALIGTTGLGIVWLGFARTEEVVIAPGKLEPVGEVKEIYLPAESVVKEILIKNGQRVEENEILIKIDQEIANERLISLSRSKLEIESQLIDTSKLIKENIISLKRSLELNKKILNSLEKLFIEGGVSQIQYLSQKNEVSEIEARIIQQNLEGRKEKSQLRSKIVDLESQINDTKILKNYKSIKSPVKGIVFDLKLTSPGFFSQIQGPILKIVPFNVMEADVEIPSRKIGFIKKGQPVDISIDSFPSNDFGVMKGTVISVGSDALPPDPQKQRPDYRFPATIELDKQYLSLRDGKQLNLQVGMSITANIKLRNVSYLQLMLGSFKSKVDSLREL